MKFEMFLNAFKFVSDASEESKQLFYEIFPEMSALEATTTTSSVKFEVMRWYDAPSIYNWFADNIPEANECQVIFEYYGVGKVQLKQLLAACVEVLADNSKAEKLLPPESGDVDESYLLELQTTVDGLTKVLDTLDGKGWFFEYSSNIT